MMNLLGKLFILRGALIWRGPRAYYLGSLVFELALLTAAVAWGLAPLGIWHAFGLWWMLLWLIPMTAAVFALYAKMPAGGG